MTEQGPGTPTVPVAISAERLTFNEASRWPDRWRHPCRWPAHTYDTPAAADISPILDHIVVSRILKSGSHRNTSGSKATILVGKAVAFVSSMVDGHCNKSITAAVIARIAVAEARPANLHGFVR
jgi:hypothetical protein